MALSGATGMALTVGAVHAAERAGFQLSDTGGFAWMVIAIACLLFMMDLLKSLPMPRDHVSQNKLGATSSSQNMVSTKAVDSVPSGFETAQRVEESIHSILSDAYDLVERKVKIHRIKTMIHEVACRERMVQRIYQRNLRQLAKRRWMMTQTRRRLNPQFRDLMAKAMDNISDFDRLMDVALSAASVKNWPILKGSIARMILLEEQSIQLVAVIRRGSLAPDMTSNQPIRVIGH